MALQLQKALYLVCHLIHVTRVGRIRNADHTQAVGEYYATLAVLALCSMLEEALRNRLGPEVGRLASLEESLNEGVKLRLLPTETLDAFKTFWKIKGRIVSDKHFRIDSEVLLTLIATATDLLKPRLIPPI